MFSVAEEVIFALRTQGMSRQKGIADRVGCSQSTVSRILKKDFPAPVNNGGRPKKTSPQDDRALKRIAHSNRFKSTTSIPHLWNETMTSPVSRSTTYRRLQFHGFSSWIPCTKPLLSCKPKTEEKTSTVCTEVFQVDGGGLEASHLLWWIEIRHGLWQQGTSCLAGKSMKGTRRLVWRRSVKHPASIMVWGCVSSRGAGSLCFLSPKTTVNTEVYIDLLDAYLLPSVDKLFADDDFVFQHDLAPAHRSYKTAKYLKEKRIDVLE